MHQDPKILICAGAKRAGKTYIVNLLFLQHVVEFVGRRVKFILGGANQSSIRRNVLDDMEQLLGRRIKLDRQNSFPLFGNRVVCLEGTNSDAWKKARGFTAAGMFLNEATALHDRFVKECFSRCSYPGARVFIDTNPENPMHPIKTDYIDKNGSCLQCGRVNIKAFNFTLFDNDTLDPDYVDSIVQSTPSGMFTDRDIYGRWVNGEGVVYRDFDFGRHLLSAGQAAGKRYVRYIYGVDWGYEHFGAIVVIGVTEGGEYVLVREIAAQHQEIDYWVRAAKSVQAAYGDYPFYADSARPEHVDRFRREGLRTINANKAVMSGIEAVAAKIKQDNFYAVDCCKRFREEIAQYAWNERTGEPVKLYDDVLDAVRYAIYTDEIPPFAVLR